MVKRAISGVGLVIVLAAAIHFGIYFGFWPLRILVTALSLIALREFFAVLLPHKPPVRWVVYAAVIYIGLRHYTLWVGFEIFVGLVFALLIMLVFFRKSVTAQDVTTALFGFFYIPFTLTFLVIIARMYGPASVWLVFISAWGSDTFAYMIGKAFGRRKLCPALSPNKTVEGAVGGVIGAAFLGFLYGSFLLANQSLFFETNTEIAIALICAFGAVLSQFGDLAASALKRQAAAKDFGALIPGHGGVLDRFDSVLFAAPSIYFMLWWAEPHVIFPLVSTYWWF